MVAWGADPNTTQTRHAAVSPPPSARLRTKIPESRLRREGRMRMRGSGAVWRLIGLCGWSMFPRLAISTRRCIAAWTNVVVGCSRPRCPGTCRASSRGNAAHRCHDERGAGNQPRERADATRDSFPPLNRAFRRSARTMSLRSAPGMRPSASDAERLGWIDTNPPSSLSDLTSRLGQ